MLHDQVKKLLAKGPASANRYMAIFSGGGTGSLGWAEGLTDQLRILNEHSNVLITNIQFPGRSFATGEMRGDMAIGHSRKYVHSMLFNEFSMTYTLTGDLATHKIFNMWLEKLAPRVGEHALTRRDVRVAYYNTYIDPKIILKKLERDDTVSLTTNVYNAFPLNVSDLALSASSNSSTLEFTVNFAYESFENFYDGVSDEQRSGGSQASQGTTPDTAAGDLDYAVELKPDLLHNYFQAGDVKIEDNHFAALGDDSGIDYNSIMKLDVGQSNEATKKLVAEEKKLANSGKSDSPQRTSSTSFNLGDGATFTLE